MKNTQIAYYGLFSALALLMGYVELLIPISFVIPGIKLGLANVVILVTLYFMGERSAFFISLIRILLSGLLFAGFAGFLYSLAGAVLSFAAMTICKRLNVFSIIGVSVMGGIFHNIGQIAVACLVVQNLRLAYYLPVLLVSGIITGIFIGIVGKYCLAYLPKR